MDFYFDENTLRGLEKRYETSATVTDYQDQLDVYKGPITEDFYSVLKFYLSNHWLDGCYWTKKEEKYLLGWKRLIIEAVNVNTGDEEFNITIEIKNRLGSSREKFKNKVFSRPFLLGLLIGLFSK
jgi:hypothetical protein